MTKKRVLKLEVNEELYNWLSRSEYAKFIGTTPELAANYLLTATVSKLIDARIDAYWKSFDVFQLIDSH